jgi:methanogenic corrinoid protein MtbC1
MTTNGPDRPASSRAQERFPDTTDAFGELSRMMLSRLSTTIEGDIIPRLMLALDPPSTQDARPASMPTELDDKVDEFVRMTLAHDSATVNRFIASLRAEGVKLSRIYLDLLAPAARRLGALWEEDEVTFTDVTIGVCRLHEVLLEFSRCFDANESAHAAGRNALLVPALGEQHTFGLFLVVEFMRRDGWNCWMGTPANLRDFRKLLRAQSFDVVGISVGADRHLPIASEQIAEARRQCQAGTAIVTGGRPFTEDPGLAVSLGADGTAPDGPAAVRQIAQLCRDTKRKATK